MLTAETIFPSLIHLRSIRRNHATLTYSPSSSYTPTWYKALLPVWIKLRVRCWVVVRANLSLREWSFGLRNINACSKMHFDVRTKIDPVAINFFILLIKLSKCFLTNQIVMKQLPPTLNLRFCCITGTEFLMGSLFKFIDDKTFINWNDFII